MTERKEDSKRSQILEQSSGPAPPPPSQSMRARRLSPLAGRVAVITACISTVRNDPAITATAEDEPDNPALGEGSGVGGPSGGGAERRAGIRDRAVTETSHEF